MHPLIPVVVVVVPFLTLVENFFFSLTRSKTNNKYYYTDYIQDYG